MRAGLWLLGAVLSQEPAPLPEGNAFVQGLVHTHKRREQALNSYSYDVLEVEEGLDKNGAVQERKSRRFEVFYVKGRPVRRLVAEDDRPLAPERQAKVDKRIREKVEAITKGNAATEEAGMRISSILERYDFRSVAREEVEARPAIVLEFAPRPGKRALDSDNVLRTLAGRLWVDEAEREVVRAEIRNTGRIRFGLGIGASVSRLEITMEFRKLDEGVWLPLRVEALAVGRILLVKGFRVRSTETYDRYRRFQVESEERVEPSPPP